MDAAELSSRLGISAWRFVNTCMPCKQNVVTYQEEAREHMGRPPLNLAARSESRLLIFYRVDLSFDPSLKRLASRSGTVCWRLGGPISGWKPMDAADEGQSRLGSD